MAIAQYWYEPWVWLDFRLAVVLTVAIPFLLLVWSLIARCPPLSHILIAYWKVSSLLAVTVYLMIGGFPLSFLTGVAARIAIPVSLWFWTDLSAAIAPDPAWVCRCFRGWRWLVTLYMGIGTIFSGAFIPCAFQQAPVSAACHVWFEPPLGFQALVHPATSNEALGTTGLVGLAAYTIILVLSVQNLMRQSQT